MKINKLIVLVVFIILIFFVPVIAQDISEEGMTLEQLIVYLTPFIVWGVAQLVKLVNKNIKGVWLLVIVGTSSGITAWVMVAAVNAEIWLLQFGYGMLSVFVHQFYKQIKSGN